MFYKTLFLCFISCFLVIYCQQNEDDKGPESFDAIKKELNCTESPKKWCSLNQTESDMVCDKGYECHDIGVENFKIGMCFRDVDSCRPENSTCCENTDCCRKVSDTNTAPLDCVQTYDNKLICKVLVV